MTSLEYWKKREDEALQHYITDERAYSERIKEIYTDTLDRAQKEIDSFYRKYAASEGITLAEAKKRVSKLDIEAYERKAARYVKDKDFSKRANEEMRLYNAAMKINRLELLKANIGLELLAGTDELEKFMGEILKGRTEEELLRQAGILGKTITNNAQAAHAIVNASFHNATFSDRIWLYQDVLRADLTKLLHTGLIQGKNPRVLARELKSLFDVSTDNAERLMRTELARVQTEAQKQSFERNGFTQYTFLANSGCCHLCKGLDGKHFNVKDMQPALNAAPMHPNCRCSTAAYSDRKEYEEWLDFLEKGGTTEEYNKLKAQGGKAKRIVDAGSLGSAKAKDFGELSAYMLKEYGIKIDKKAQTLDFESVRDSTAGIEWVLKTFPETQGYLKKLGAKKGGVMQCTGDSIFFDPVAFGGSYYKGNHAFFISTGVHEAAHMTEGYLIHLQTADKQEFANLWNSHTVARSIVREAVDMLPESEVAGKKQWEIYRTISPDASINSSECLAEAVADVYKNGENASQLAKNIFAILQREIK